MATPWRFDSSLGHQPQQLKPDDSKAPRKLTFFGAFAFLLRGIPVSVVRSLTGILAGIGSPHQPRILRQDGRIAAAFRSPGRADGSGRRRVRPLPIAQQERIFFEPLVNTRQSMDTTLPGARQQVAAEK
ncbi:MAG: hypothetical protein V5B34_16505 [Accumulibacter sp.]